VKSLFLGYFFSFTFQFPQQHTVIIKKSYRFVFIILFIIIIHHHHHHHHQHQHHHQQQSCRLFPSLKQKSSNCSMVEQTCSDHLSKKGEVGLLPIRVTPSYKNRSTEMGTIVSVVRWSNFMGVDGLNGRILLDLPILRKDDCVYFKTSSTTTCSMRRKTLFCFKFTDAKCQAEEIEMCWLKLNGSIVPLQGTTNAATVRTTKRKGNLMVPAVVNGYGIFGLIVEAKLYVPKYIANEDDDSESNAGYIEDVIIDKDDEPQSQNWMTAFAPY
jgi:hypothetical protein